MSTGPVGHILASVAHDHIIWHTLCNGCTCLSISARHDRPPWSILDAEDKRMTIPDNYTFDALIHWLETVDCPVAGDVEQALLQRLEKLGFTHTGMLYHTLIQSLCVRTGNAASDEEQTFGFLEAMVSVSVEPRYTVYAAVWSMLVAWRSRCKAMALAVAVEAE